VRGDHAQRVPPSVPPAEKALQHLVERNLPTMLGVQFLASEYPTGWMQSGRIDTLAIDDHAVPVVIEYKRRKSPSLITQGLYYLEWLQDHRADYQMLVYDRLGADAPEAIDWEMPRLICVAPGFSRYDLAVRHQAYRIELVQYQWFGWDVLMLERAGSRWW
jgi:hypothetical protein